MFPHKTPIIERRHQKYYASRTSIFHPRTAPAHWRFRGRAARKLADRTVCRLLFTAEKVLMVIAPRNRDPGGLDVPDPRPETCTRPAFLPAGRQEGRLVK